MTTIEKFKYSSHTYMFFDGELFENFLKKEKKIEELTTKEGFYQFNEPMIGFITSNEYEMQTHGLTWENKKIHTKGNEIVDELFVSTTNFDDTNFNDVIKNIKLPNQTKINHSIGDIARLVSCLQKIQKLTEQANTTLNNLEDPLSFTE